MRWKESAPINGLDLKSLKSEVQDGFALQLNNLLPDFGAVKVRRGYFPLINFNTLMPVTRIMKFADAKQMIYASGSQLFINGSPIYTGAQSDYWVEAYLKHNLYLCNGFDTAKVYNGTAVSDIGFTNALVSIQNYAWCANLNGEIVFGMPNSLDIYAPGVGVVSGPLNLFSLSQYAKRGGYIVCAVSWGRDASDGFHSYSGFYTSEGELIVYEGAGFGDASGDVSLVGNFYIGRPLGPRPYINYGAEIIFITQSGLMPMSAIVANGEVIKRSDLFSDLINNLFADGPNSQEWCAHISPKQNIAIFNLPAEYGNRQAVMNINTGAWSTFSGFDALDFADDFDGNLLIAGRDGTVYQYGGLSDNGGQIETTIQFRYSKCGTDYNKLFKLFGLRLESSDEIRPTFTVAKDYLDKTLGFSESAGNTGNDWAITDDPNPALADPTDPSVGIFWDSEKWGGLYPKELYKWHSISGYGQALSVICNISTKDIDYKIYENLYEFEVSRGKL
ncbi:MAG: hypothetical protein LBJ18_03655 [Rickettsiales bacterium]|jgi:hypothetical protein|nr:hypothetical protein [Rickettsiales bacterium]